ncbi:hypothetical protein LJB94_02225 [Odoribacter sp. OttesenSCG-928-G04]|nr:hypothetical protein [Odoribacter sp. OttesenSCG-928-G04]
MKEGNSHLGLGMALGALLGAAATYLIVKNKDVIRREIENMTEKVKEKMDSVRETATEKVHDAAAKVEEKTRK